MNKLLASCNNAFQVVINGYPIRLYVEEQFSEEELDGLITLYPMFKNYSRQNKERELDFFKNIDNLDSPNNRVYAFVLALFQRICLPMEYIASNHVPNYLYRLSEELSNFQLLNRNFDNIYSQLFVLKANIKTNQKDDTEERFIRANAHRPKGHKSRLYVEVYRSVLRLWLSGYSLTNEFGYEPISITELLLDRELSNEGLKHQVIRVLNHMLIKLETSPVKEIIDFNKRKTLVELSENSWGEFEITAKSEIFDELKSFTFGALLERTKMPCELEYEDIEGNPRTEIWRKIELSTWNGKARAMLAVVTRLTEKGYLTIADALNGGIQEIIADTSREKRSRLDTFKTVLREWISYYSKTNNLNIKAEKIIASNLGRNETRHGKSIHYSAACELIETLLDDQSPYHKDNHIGMFRCRRACLLLLESSARIHEITILKQSCIKTNNHGEKFLHFHKTKTGKTRTVPLSEEGEKWVKQLLEVAPKEKIPIKKDKYKYGDGLNVPRLFANYAGTGPLPPEVVGKYLKRLQEKMWGNSPKGGRFFTPHDVRRMCAVYMKMTGHSDEEIKEYLGHEDISSQIPYLLTKPKSHLEHFKAIYERGIWSDNQEDSESTAIYNQTVKILDNEKDTKLARTLIQTFIEKFKDIELPSENYLPENEAAGGFPLRSHNCVAKATVTCHHTEIKCFGCEFYNPDSNKLIHHKAEVLRWIIFLYHNTNVTKTSKNSFEKHKVAARVDDVEENLKATFNNLFQKFNMDKKAVKKLEAELYTKAKNYQRKYGKTKHSLTFKEAMEFYKKGVLDG